MARIPGIELDELYVKYQLHPQLLDLYVEGEFDKDILNSLFVQRGISTYISVLTVNEVEVPDSEVAALGLSVGSNKNRLIVLANLFSGHLEDVATNVSCIIDADLDRLLGKLLEVRHLLYTDFTCLEMYCVNDTTLSRFFSVACNLNNTHRDDFLKYAEKILPAQFCVRGTNEQLSLHSVTPPFDKGLRSKNGLGHFDGEVLLRQFIHLNNLHDKTAAVCSSYKSLFAAMPNDIRNKTQGHDFVELLFYYVANAGGPRLQKNEHVPIFGGRLLAASLDSATAFSEPMFRRIQRAIDGEPLWPAVQREG